MADTSLSDTAGLPHHAYAEAIAHCDGGPGGRYQPDEWTAFRSDTGLLCAVFYYRRTELMTVQDSYGLDRTLVPVVNGEAWPHGLALNWDSAEGWFYTHLEDEFSTVGEHWDPLPVPRLAAPAAIRALLPPLLHGDEYSLPPSAEEWEEPRAQTLAHQLAAADLRQTGDAHD